MNKSKRRIRPLSMVSYGLAAILAAYAVWAFLYCNDNVAKLIANQQLTVSGNEFLIVNYYMTNGFQNILYAVAFFIFGRLYHVAGRGRQAGTERPQADEAQTPPVALPDNDEDADRCDEFRDWELPQ